jgi:hypothetical protein
MPKLDMRQSTHLSTVGHYWFLFAPLPCLTPSDAAAGEAGRPSEKQSDERHERIYRHLLRKKLNREQIAIHQTGNIFIGHAE